MPKPPPYRLYNCDCFELFAKLPSGSVDMVMVDLPYGMTDLEWDKVIPADRMWKELKRILKAKGQALFTASQPFTSLMVLSNLNWFRTEWIWKKNAGSNFGTTKWHPMKEHESIIVFGETPGTYNPIKQPRTTPIKAGYTNHSNTGKRKAYAGVEHNRGFTVTDGEMRCPSSVQMFNRERGLHPNQKPVALIEYFVKTYTNPGDTVLDFAMGSGTTGVACGNLGRRFIGCDNDIEYGYFGIATERIKNAYLLSPCPIL